MAAAAPAPSVGGRQASGLGSTVTGSGPVAVRPAGAAAGSARLAAGDLRRAQVPLLLRAYDRTGQTGAHRPMRSRATCRHTWQPACLTGMPKLWA